MNLGVFRELTKTYGDDAELDMILIANKSCPHCYNIVEVYKSGSGLNKVHISCREFENIDSDNRYNAYNKENIDKYLSETIREIALLKYVHHVPETQISYSLGINIGRIFAYLGKARRIINERVKLTDNQ